MSLILAIIVGFISIMVPGFFISIALLRKTGLSLFEITVIGFILGLIIPPSAIWLESYLIPVSHSFSFSENLYNINIVIITIIGVILAFQQGALSDLFGSRGGAAPTTLREISADYKSRITELRHKVKGINADLKVVAEHQKQEEELVKSQAHELEMLNVGPEEREKIKQMHAQQEKKLYEQHEREEMQLLDSGMGKKSFKLNWIFILLFALMIITFYTRIINIGTATNYFEFDPYFDMISTQNILTYGYQIQLSHEAWPTLTNGTVERLQPIVPYLEAYWFELAGGNSAIPANQSETASVTNSNPPNTALLSLVSSWYPPIAAALLVFVVFLILYHIYGEIPGIIGAAFAAVMPTLITTFIAGEQLLEPWGIFAMFFFVAAYLLAVKYPKEKRYAILAGIAFASNFLGAHYYTVTTGILAMYILLQGIFNVFKKRDSRDFYIMNTIVIIVIAITYAFYGPYEATLTQKTSAVFGIPEIVAFPLFALLLVAIFEYLPKILHERKYIPQKPDFRTYLTFLAIIIVLGLLITFLTPLGAPIRDYINLSTKYTTPSSPLFMTVQEYAPTGINFDFGSGGFGLIGASVLGANLLVWLVLIIFGCLIIYTVIIKDSQNGIFLAATVIPLTVAGMLEVKYLPHFGVGYILAIGVIIGESFLLVKNSKSEMIEYVPGMIIFLAIIAAVMGSLNGSLGYALIGGVIAIAAELLVVFLVKKDARPYYSILVIAAVIIILEGAPALYAVISASGQSCTAVVQAQNSLGDALFCNTVPNYWLVAMKWASQNIGPYGPRILSWWDYGDWINWFGNSNAVLRGDNSVPASDYQAAAYFVLGPKLGFNSTAMAKYMNGIQAKYVLFDDQLVPKWGALDFLGCVYVNQTSQAYATAAGKANNQPYVLGTSNCEITHDPAEIWIPTNPTVSNYCQLANTSITAVQAEVILGLGQSAVNQSYCAPVSFLQGTTVNLLYPNGTKTNIVVTTQLYQGGINLQGTELYTFIALYLPNGPNNTITDAPSEFYNSNYYDGYFLGKMPGFTRVYPSNFTGINYINSTNKVVIYAVNNYTGGNTPHTSKPSYLTNNFTVPG